MFSRLQSTCLGLVLMALALPSPAADTTRIDFNFQIRPLLSDRCFTCHGRAGQGGAFNYPAPALAQTQLPVEAFKIFVRAGPNDMPAYAESVLSDKDVADIHAFLRSLPGRRWERQKPQPEWVRRECP